jgi:hypothetical protein
MSLIEKIDAEIERLKIEHEQTIWKENKIVIDIKILEACEIKELIIAEQKEPLTIGHKIRENNESLVEWYADRVNIYVCGEPVIVNPLNKEKCLNYLSQPYTEQLKNNKKER